MATRDENKQDDVVSFELPAPAGWVKKFTPKKEGTTPQRNEIVFISPSGEEIKNKRKLNQYLKSHLGGPAINEFDWGTGDTPRRSARLSEKTKAPEGLTSSSPKRRRKSLNPKESKEKSNADAAGETKEDVDVGTSEGGEDEVITQEVIPEKPDMGTEIELKVGLDEPFAAETQIFPQTENPTDNVPKPSDVSLEAPSAFETQNDSTENLNRNAKRNEESNCASLEKETPHENVYSGQPIVEDKNTDDQESEKPIEKAYSGQPISEDKKNADEQESEKPIEKAYSGQPTSEDKKNAGEQESEKPIEKAYSGQPISEDKKNTDEQESEKPIEKAYSGQPTSEDKKNTDEQESEKPIENDEQEPKVISDEPSAAAETQNDNAQKYNDVAQEVPPPTEIQNDSTAENLNGDAEKSNHAKNEESNRASPRNEAPDAKVYCGEPIIEEKNVEEPELEKAIDNEAGLHEQEPTRSSS